MKELIVANWKMNLGGKESLKFVEEYSTLTSDSSQLTEAVICPPTTALWLIADRLKELGLGLGAQNMHYEEKGAFTGETSPAFLKEIPCDYVIIGHSERRQYFNEEGEFLNRKVKAAYQWAIKPILCVGENLKQRQEGKAWETVQGQLKEALANFTSQELKDLVVAYEPVWAIGTGQWAEPQDAQEISALIRQELKEVPKLRILYGGSVKAENINDYMACQDIDGALVGGASLLAKDFYQLVNRER